MKNLWFLFSLALPLFMFTGCDDKDEDDDEKIPAEYVNKGENAAAAEINAINEYLYMYDEDKYSTFMENLAALDVSKLSQNAFTIILPLDVNIDLRGNDILRYILDKPMDYNQLLSQYEHTSLYGKGKYYCVLDEAGMFIFDGMAIGSYGWENFPPKKVSNSYLYPFGSYLEGRANPIHGWWHNFGKCIKDVKVSASSKELEQAAADYLYTNWDALTFYGTHFLPDGTFESSDMNEIHYVEGSSNIKFEGTYSCTKDKLTLNFSRDDTGLHRTGRDYVLNLGYYGSGITYTDEIEFNRFLLYAEMELEEFLNRLSPEYEFEGQNIYSFKVTQQLSDYSPKYPPQDWR